MCLQSSWVSAQNTSFHSLVLETSVREEGGREGGREGEIKRSSLNLGLCAWITFNSLISEIPEREGGGRRRKRKFNKE